MAGFGTMRRFVATQQFGASEQADVHEFMALA